MALLLDTCVLYWLASDQLKLSERATREIASNEGELFVSAVSAFEVAMNHRKRRFILPAPPEEWFRDLLRLYRIRSKPVTSAIALRSVTLPPHHNDPADRQIVATAERYGWPVVTPDRHIAQYTEVTVVW